MTLSIGMSKRGCAWHLGSLYHPGFKLHSISRKKSKAWWSHSCKILNINECCSCWGPYGNCVNGYIQWLRIYCVSKYLLIKLYLVFVVMYIIFLSKLCIVTEKPHKGSVNKVIVFDSQMLPFFIATCTPNTWMFTCGSLHTHTE